jgi:CheY-like chemotaxis protein
MKKSAEVILCVDDDENDAFFVKRAFQDAGITQPLVVVEDGKTAIDYIAGEGPYTDRARHAPPCLILLDLNMPGMTGIDVLKWIRSTPRVCTLPVIVLTSSNQDSDINRAYVLGANGYLTKPSRIEDFVTMARAIKGYWLEQNRRLIWTDFSPELSSERGLQPTIPTPNPG